MWALPRSLPFAWLCGVRPIRISAELSSNAQAKLRVPYGSRPPQGPDRLGGREKDPGRAFVPGAVSPATSSASVVYWAPGSLPKPNPPSSRCRIAARLTAPGPEKRLDANTPAPDAGQITAGLPPPASSPGPGPWPETYR